MEKREEPVDDYRRGDSERAIPIYLFIAARRYILLNESACASVRAVRERSFRANGRDCFQREGGKRPTEASVKRPAGACERLGIPCPFGLSVVPTGLCTSVSSSGLKRGTGNDARKDA